jgi:hypothetical protein
MSVVMSARHILTSAYFYFFYSYRRSFAVRPGEASA